jgi:formylmethanofuran dehydrogenase subunit E
VEGKCGRMGTKAELKHREGGLAAMDFELLLKVSTKIHGHLCPGQVLGVKMSILGLREIGITDPKGKDRKSIIVFVEMDRCATDAIQSVTGCSLGHRTMKFMDYGKMAATFLNLETGRAVRVIAKEESRQKAREYFPDIRDKHTAQLEAYKVMPDEELFDCMAVEVRLGEEDLPGPPLKRIECSVCGEYIQDRREVYRNRRVLCKACGGGGYYISGKPFLSPSVMQRGHSGMAIRSKLWIEVSGEPVFGRGRRFLLEAIETYGSINRAAKEINISYRKAWGYIKAMEERLNMKLVERQTGGKNGGGAVLTEDARKFLRNYEALESGMQELVDERFDKIFMVKGS